MFKILLLKVHMLWNPLSWTAYLSHDLSQPIRGCHSFIITSSTPLLIIISDPYVVVSVDDAKILRTRVKKDDLNPVWNDLFELEVNHEGEDLFFWYV